MKDKLLLCGFAFVLMLFSSSIYAQVPCDTGCNANDFSSINYRLANEDGSDLDLAGTAPGTPVTAYLWSTFSGQASRYKLMVYFEVVQDGMPLETINKCWVSELAGNEIPVGSDQMLVSVTWNYGAELRLRNLYLGWQVNSGAACGCANRAHCFYSPTDLVVETPVMASFDYTPTCDEPGLSFQKVNFESTTTGGAQPYNYSWDLGNGATPAQSTLENPVVNYSTGGTKTVTLTITDNSGNTSIFEEEITVNPCCALTLTTPADISVECDESTAPENTGSATASDNGVPLTASYTDVVVPGENTNEYTVNRTWSVTNSCNDIKSEVQIITVSDNSAPVITVPDGITTEANVGITYIGPIGTATASDNCDPGVVITNDAPAVFPLGTTTVIWTATDASENTVQGTQLVTVIDIKPVVLGECAPDQIVNANTSCQALVPDFTASLVELLPNDGNIYTVTQSPLAGTTVIGTGPHLITLTVTDQSENSSTCQANLFVNDATPPVITVPADFNAASNQGCTYVGLFGQATGTDNCDGSVEISNNAPAAFPVGKTIVTWRATDASGNTSTGTQNVTISDDDAPVIATCPGNISLAANENDSYLVPDFLAEYGITITETCGDQQNPGYTVVQEPAAGTILGIGIHDVTITVTDTSKNVSTCVFQISVESIITTSFEVCPGIIDVQAIVCFGECTAIVPDFSEYAVLNEGAVSMSQIPAPGTWIKGSGFHTVTLTALDGEGNSSVCESGLYIYSIAIEGCEPAVVDVISGCQATVPDLTQSISLSTVCGEPMPESEFVIVQSPAPGTLLGIGQYPLTFSVKNMENKVVASCSTTVTIADDSAPVVSCPTTPVTITLKAEVVMNRFGIWRTYKGYLPNNLVTATDNCTAASKLVFSYAQTTFTQADLGFHNVFVEVTDASGNVGTCQIPVFVKLPLKNSEIGNIATQDQNELLQLNVQAYPNPTTGKMWIQIDNLNNPEVSAKVYNTTGSVVFEQTISTDGRIDVDLSGNVEGIYLLKVVADQKEFIHKIILQKR